jgi:hypothetical protein
MLAHYGGARAPVQCAGNHFGFNSRSSGNALAGKGLSGREEGVIDRGFTGLLASRRLLRPTNE